MACLRAHRCPQQEEKEAAQISTQTLLDALDKGYDGPCEVCVSALPRIKFNTPTIQWPCLTLRFQGTAFYALQCCFNHSCSPSALAEGEASGDASILALLPVTPGQEITISYIDEGLSFKERQLALRDYGFECACEKCVGDKRQRRRRAAKGQQQPGTKRSKAK